MTTPNSGNPPTNSTATAVTTGNATPKINTYNCLCHTTLLATTYTLTLLPRRSPTSLDRAYILPCPRLLRRHHNHNHNHNNLQNENENENEMDLDTPPDSQSSSSSSEDDDDEDDIEDSTRRLQNITTLTSLTIQPTPQLLTKSNGIEKRYLVRCKRCETCVGYRLDWNQFQNSFISNSSNTTATENEVNGESKSRKKGQKKSGRRDDVLYILPGAVVSTEEMMRGQNPEREEVEFGGVLS